MSTPIRSCEGQPKIVRGFETCSEAPFGPKECNYIDWYILELNNM